MKQKINILGIDLFAVDKYQALDLISEFFQKRHSSLICTVNVEFIMRALANSDFKNILNQKSSLNLIDGYGVVWSWMVLGSWRPNLTVFKELYVILQWLLSLIFYPFVIAFGRRTVPRVSGSDFLWELAKWASANQKSIFLLGNKYGLDPNVLEKTSLELQTKFYDLKIAGTYSGSWKIEDEKETVGEIKNSGADMIFCGFGSPKQEEWLSRNLSKTGAKIGIGLGGSFDFISGAQKRAPRLIQNLGFEWLYRLINHPKRLARQYSIIYFIFKVLSVRLS